MILVDTNILITILRTHDPRLIGLLRQENAAVCGIVRTELLQGAHTPKERTLAAAMLANLGNVLIPESVWDDAGDNLRLLRAARYTVPFQDGVLATLAITAGVELWTRDKHFEFIQQVLPALRLFAEPP